MELDIDRWPARSWGSAWTRDESARAASVLERGGLVVLPDCAFAIAPNERCFLDPRWLDGSAKNIGLDGRRLSGTHARGDEAGRLHALIARFAGAAAGLVERMLPDYRRHVRTARTSFRPAAVCGRLQSPREDDTRLHVDAFPSRPNQGERILRVFCNVNPSGEDRVWRVGEPFAEMAARFLPSIRPMRAGESALLRLRHITKGRRSEYDHVMLALHDRAKLDAAYQRSAPRREVRFAPGTTWLCFSDQAMNAAISGQHMMEQTLLLPLAALSYPASSPLAVLERLAGRRMA